MAATRTLAEDAAERVVLDLEPLGPSSTRRRGRRGRALLHPDWGDNVLAEQSLERGDPTARSPGADIIVARPVPLGRATGLPLETRGAIVAYDAGRECSRSRRRASRRITRQRRSPRRSGGATEDVRVVVPDVGGSFGIKDHACVEEVALCVLAPAVGRPVEWIEDRWESIVAGVHSRAQHYELELRPTPTDASWASAAGCRSTPAPPAATTASAPRSTPPRVLPGPYKFAHYRLDVAAVVTNKSPAAAYRGYGAPEAAFAMEGMLDRLARACGLAPAEVRRRNLLGPGELPGLQRVGLPLRRRRPPARARSSRSSSRRARRPHARATGPCGAPGSPASC